MAQGPGARIWRVISKRWRARLRSLHRDVGYLIVGLTFVYALSGIAINHLEDWDPNFSGEHETVELSQPLPQQTDEAVAVIKRELGILEAPSNVEDYGVELEVEFGRHRTVRADRESGQLFDDRQEPRFFLRVANWLHYNRGKAAWTYVADSYAILLLFLAVSGVVMLRGRKGFLGRGVILISLGVLVPIVYVHLAGGP